MELLMDISLLGMCTALVHYAFGAVGLGLLVVTLALVEHRSELQWLTPTTAKRALASRRRTMVKRFDRQATWRARMVRDDNDAVSSDEQDFSTQRQDIRGVLEAAASVESDDDDLDVSSVASESVLTVSSPTAAAARAQLSRLVVRDLGDCNGVFGSAQVLHEEQPGAASRDRKPQAHRRVTMNSRAPIPFETDLFTGHIYFLVRTAPEDPHWRHLFTGKRRRFWIQVQGRFKRAPAGVVYLGGELPSQISLGLFTKSIALVIMGIIQKLVGKVSFCFGDTTDSQLPFVSFPLYQSVDQFVATPAGEQPPPLGREDFGETDEQRRRRRMTPIGAERFEVGPTYSFHFHTMYVNLTHWKTANLPGMSDMKLTTFFDSLPLRIVAYDIPATTSDPHAQARKKYLFCFEVEHDEHRQHCDASNRQHLGAPRLWRSDSVGSLESSSSNETGVSGTTYDSSPCPTVIPEDSIVTSDQRDASQALSTTASHESASDTVVKTNTAALVMIEKLRLLFWFEEVDGSEATRRVFYALQFEQHGVLRVAVVSAYKLRLLFGKYRELDRLYDLQRLRFHARSRIGAYSIIDEEAAQVAIDLDRLLQVTRQTWETTETDLRVLTFSSALYECMTSRLHLLVANSIEATKLEDAVTPSSIGVTLSRRDRDEMDVVYEGVVYRFCAPTIARQEVLVITSSQLLFYRSFSSRADKTIDNSRVIGVQAVPMPHVPTSSSTDFAFALQISTFAEEVTICVSLESARNDWIRVVLQHCCPHTNFERALQGIGEPWVVCYTPLKALQPADRVILNTRSLFPRVGRDDRTQSPITMVAASLRAALSIHRQHDTTHADVMAVLEFLNLASALRTIDLDEVVERPHEERMVFFLNLYHAVLAHAIISHGYPRNKAQWETFQLRMCYAVGFDTTNDAAKVPITMSLAEIEHIILRGRLPRPPSGVPHLRLDRIPAGQLVRLSRFALAHPDFRLAFAILMNQDSQDAAVVVYEADHVHQQLNDTVQRYINQRIRVDLARQCIVLPRVCDWYRLDYGGGGAPMYCVRKLLGFLEENVQQEVMAFMESPGRVQVKYDAFSYTPRAFFQSHEASTA
ncbi:hypothetical protein PINS_up002131 [Pythium insidiosum]|nr:hypothetical protein PINS_up002131 [Pythium insidiosum]